MTPRVLVALGVGVLVGLVARPTYPQSLPLTGYLQSVPIGSGESELAPSNLSHFNRFRVSTDPVFGSVRVEAAYEHVLTLRRRDVLFGLGVGVVPAGGEWLDLQWTIAEEEHVLWQHRFDRLAVGWSPTDRIEVSAGRQAVSWGTTLFLTPSDPFTPFNPADPFREFRAGVDAARVRVSPSSLSEIDVVVAADRVGARP